MTREEVKRASRWTPVFGCSPPIILVNVLDPGNPAHTRENAAKDCSVSDGQAVCQADHVLLDTLVVRAGENTLERDTDYIAAHAKAGSGMEVKITLTLLYILIELDGEPMVELDKLNEVFKIRGKDMLAEIKEMC